MSIKDEFEKKAGSVLVVDAAGDKQWYRNGELHREDGPAIEWDDGNKEWYRNGQRHRDDGPAAEHANGNKSWFRDGVKLTDEQVAALLQELQEQKVKAENLAAEEFEEGVQASAGPLRRDMPLPKPTWLKK